MGANACGMSRYFKCGHDLVEHDVYEGCQHTHHVWLKSRRCISSNYQPTARCDCERCVKKD